MEYWRISCCVQDTLAVWEFVCSLDVLLYWVLLNLQWETVWILSLGILCQQFLVLNRLFPVMMLCKGLESKYLLELDDLWDQDWRRLLLLSQLKTVCHWLLCREACVWNQQRRRTCSNCRERGLRIQFLLVKEMKVAGFSQRKLYNACHRLSCSLLDQRTHWNNNINSTVLSVESLCGWVLVKCRRISGSTRV